MVGARRDPAQAPMGSSGPHPGLAWRAAIGDDGAIDALTEGQKVWVEQADGSQRAAIFVGEAEASWFGGSPGAYVVYPDTRDGQEVELMRIIARDEG